MVFPEGSPRVTVSPWTPASTTSDALRREGAPFVAPWSEFCWVCKAMIPAGEKVQLLASPYLRVWTHW